MNHIPVIVEALLALSEQLSFSQDDQSNSIFDFGDEVIISRKIKRLLSQTDETLRFEILKKSITQGQGLKIINELIAIPKEQHNQSNQPEWLVNSKHLQELEEAIAKNNN